MPAPLFPTKKPTTLSKPFLTTTTTPPVSDHPLHAQMDAALKDLVTLKADVAALKAEHVGIWRALGAATRVVP